MRKFKMNRYVVKISTLSFDKTLKIIIKLKIVYDIRYVISTIIIIIIIAIIIIITLFHTTIIYKM